MEQERKKTSKVGVGIAILIAIVALILGIIFPLAGGKKSGENAGNLSYDSVEPYVKEYLTKQGAINANGNILLATTTTTGNNSSSSNNSNTSSTSNETTETTVKNAVNELLQSGQISYIKGADGKTGATGAMGSTGATGQNGTNGANGKDGTNANISAENGTQISGGVISLKPCAVNEVLLSDGSTWNCADVQQNTNGSVSGIEIADGNARNSELNLILNDTSLTANIVDSQGLTVISNTVDFSGSLATKADIANLATNAALGNLDARVQTLENAGFATENWVQTQNYLTSSALDNYYTKTDTDTNLAQKQDKLPVCAQNQVIKYDAANSVWVCANDSDSASVNNATQDWVNSQNFAKTSDLANYYTKDETDAIVSVKADQTDLDNLGLAVDNLQNQVNGKQNTLIAGQNISITGDTISANIDLSAYATENYVNSQGFLKNADLADFAKTADVNSALGAKQDKLPVCADQQVVKFNTTNSTWECAADNDTSTDLSAYVKTVDMNSTLADYAQKTDLANYYTKTETDSALANFAKKTDLDNYYTKTETDTKLANKQDKLPVCTDQQVVKYDLANANWICADDKDTIQDLTAYATQAWVNSQNYLTQSALTDYAKTADVDQKLTAYVSHNDFAETLNQNIFAGPGIAISADNEISSTVDTNIFQMTADHLAETAPDDKKVYLDSSTDPLSEWIFLNGRDGSTTDPTLATSWLKVGDLSADLTAYAKTADVATELSGKEDKLPTCAQNQVLKFDTASSSWICANDNDTQPDLSTYAKTADLANYAQKTDLANYYTSAETDSKLANKQDTLPVCNSGEVIKYNTTNSKWECGTDNNTSTDLSNYVTTTSMNSTLANYAQKSDLTPYATQTWVSSQNYLTSSALATYATTAYVDTQDAKKQDKLPTCSANQVVKYSATAPNWVCAADNDTTYDLSTYVQQSALANYLLKTDAASTYATQSSVATALAGKQNTITGGATTITDTNLAANSILQSDANGKVAASTITLSQLQGALTNISAIQTQQAANTAAITNLQNTQGSTNSLGNYGEIATGQTYRGKPVYRNDLYLAVNSSANQVSDLQLIGGGVVDQIINVGGSWMIGFGTETWQIGADTDGQNYGYVMKRDGDGALVFRSRANNARNGSSNGNAYIIVEYTKK